MPKSIQYSEHWTRNWIIGLTYWISPPTLRCIDLIPFEEARYSALANRPLEVAKKKQRSNKLQVQSVELWKCFLDIQRRVEFVNLCQNLLLLLVDCIDNTTRIGVCILQITDHLARTENVLF